MNRLVKRGAALLLALALACAALPAEAAGLKVIRDEEIERGLQTIARPIFEQAGLSAETVRLVLIEDSTLNAFVAGGQNIFFHTGLILSSKNAAELAGVIAHESGHISAGHLFRMREEADSLTAQSLITSLLGIAVAIGAKSGDAGMAISNAGQSVALRGMLRHSRVQETAADQAGVRFLQGAGLPVSGFMSFMEQLSSQELLPDSQQSEYVRTHPMSQDRVDFLRHTIEKSPRDGQTPAAWNALLERMQRKLEGYLYPDRALARKGADANTRYGHAIAHYRKGAIERALPLLDGLLAEEPGNPYFHELKGQILFERGRVKEALPEYAAAVKAAPKSGLIAAAYGHALLEDKQLDKAARTLDGALRLEPRMAQAYHLLAIAYGRQGKEGLSRLHLAEEALLQKKLDHARTEANLALNALPKSSASALRALDILDEINRERRRAKN